MLYNFSNMGGIADKINSLETEHDIKVFLTMYRKWYINERKYSKFEAQRQVLTDLKYYTTKFIKKQDLIEKISKVVGFNFVKV